MQKISQNQVILLTSVVAVAIGFILSILFFGLLHNRALLTKQQNDPSLQGIYKKNLKIELVIEGLSYPTSMSFVDENKILVLEKNTGLVRLISHGVLQDKPVLRLPIDAEGERGLLGIAVLHKNNNKTDSVNTNVFLYFTESDNKSSNIRNDEQLRNRVYKYDWNGQTLVNPTLILDLPAIPGPYHNGGKLIIGPDRYLYTVVGDLAGPKTQAQNNKTGPPIDGTGGILRVTQDGKPVSDPPLGNKYPLNLYYAYGIRNSFGIAFDPVNGKLWDTENGEDKYDEINVLKPGFNSGWSEIMGPLARNNISDISKGDLVNFPRSYYSEPVFSWYHPIGVTDIEFLKSSKLGDKYKNNIFVGDINNGNLYYFQLNGCR
ncbi:MAG: PQQ-dependent sugar dehydrogenase [Thermoproteota archaeon]|nr:PQQ-dependent sugar dehydrogenase [Thermoproteota archaeon]